VRLGLDESDFKNGGSERLIDSIVAWGDLNVVGNRIRAHQFAMCGPRLHPGTHSNPQSLPSAELRELAAALLRA